ncbi:solute carrier family 23 protein [Halalkalibacter nanhaiisediminis]|uniref:Permease family protein n=1 Tax=Halalkalibacter nanhaiisediminis TaxID=688079 RepID=A0A562QHC0_9BACI|nr:solute carrier family 23 protein [Halalkalibacter nanhaiisediminis]TWI56147.1 permease family protein [Halalkalibacter nanhaiisediminis]
MSIYKRKEGQEQPYWPAGPFKVRLPFVHYRFEAPEFVQALIMFVVSLGMIPLLTEYLGLPYQVALAYVFIGGIGFMLPALLGVAMVPGWITPAIPVVLLFLGNFQPGPEAIQALFALQFIVFLIFFILGITKLGGKLVDLVPNSLKAGILIGAGLAALMGEIQNGGRLMNTPISLIIGSLVAFYILFSLSFKQLVENNKIAKVMANYGLVPAMVIAMIIGWMVSEYPMANVEWGITQPAFIEMWSYLPFAVGFPSLDIFLLAVPTAIIAYIIAFGDIIVGKTLLQRADNVRKDEKIDTNVDRVHLVTALRNLIHSFFAPYPGLAGPLWTPVHATMVERYKYGRKAMDSIHSGMGTFWIAGFIALFILPLVSLFQPVLPIALSLTLIITAYVCISVGIEQVHTTTERGVAGIMAVVLAIHGATYGLIAGVVLYFLIEKTTLFKAKSNNDVEDEVEEKKVI